MKVIFFKSLHVGPGREQLCPIQPVFTKEQNDRDEKRNGDKHEDDDEHNQGRVCDRFGRKCWS